MPLNENLTDLMPGWTETKAQLGSAGACFLDASDWYPGGLAGRRVQGWSGGLAPSPTAVQEAAWSSTEPQFFQPQNGNKNSDPYLPSPLHSK